MVSNEVIPSLMASSGVASSWAASTKEYLLLRDFEWNGSGTGGVGQVILISRWLQVECFKWHGFEHRVSKFRVSSELLTRLKKKTQCCLQ